ncbi:MAG: PEP-CTERM sorting domain-containing protein [Phycisphaerales bacterium]|nr:PEP-CTERM sorting domain-containing protein [Phycisphaerales bacterium]
MDMMDKRAKHLWLVGLMAALITSAASADAIITYAPTGVVAGESTAVTISVTDATGAGFGLGQVRFNFTADPGMTIDSFAWMSGLNGVHYSHTDALANPMTLLGSLFSVQVPASGTIPIAQVMVTVDENANVGDHFTLVSSVMVKKFPTFAQLPIAGDGIDTEIHVIVPEPATMMLLASGGLLMLRRRRA